jgi:hypothetical protein
MFVINTIPSDLAIVDKVGNILETDERLVTTDLICEGTVEGLVDKDGNLLKYVSVNNSSIDSNLCLGKGVYYNDVPLIDSKVNKLNFINLGFNISYGEEVSSPAGEFPSTIHRYNQKIYLNELDYTKINNDILRANPLISTTQTSVFSFQNVDGVCALTYASQKATVNNTSDFAALLLELDRAKNNCQEFNHKIQNKYADLISVHVKIDQLFNTDSGGSTQAESLVYVIEFSEDNSANRHFTICSVVGVSKSGYVNEVVFQLKLNNQKQNSYYVKIYALSAKIQPGNGKVFKEFSVSSIIEKVTNRGSFNYPFSALVKSSVSSRHFQSDPARTFDMKMLKIKVPQNYDPEAREYVDNWNGNYDGFLRWTDNPAWIYYDLCTNSRYGIGNGKIFEKDLNKWELYKISKYCDELVKSNEPIRCPEFSFYRKNDDDKNCIFVAKTDAISLSDFIKKFPPVKVVSNTISSSSGDNGGLCNSIIFLYDMLDSNNNKLTVGLKKIIWSIEDLGTSFKIKLINDFGPRRAFENEPTGDLLKYFIAYCEFEKTDGVLKTKIARSVKNSESEAKSKILDWFASNINEPKYSKYINSVINKSCFNNDLSDGSIVNGKCLPRVKNFRDPLEARFSANVLIDNETDCLKVLNDLASIFRGLTYYKNNLITATIDVDKKTSYIFNNTNVKDGLFTYSSGSLEALYTVAKIMYKDKFNNFNEQVEIVEDTKMMGDYGIITKEILGFGISSRGQARRIGTWMLATNRFENQTITFSTDLQGLNLKPSDVIQVQDQYKNDSFLQGRVTSVDYASKYITVDRKLNLNLAGCVIKFIFDNIPKSIEDLNALSSVSLSDVDSLNASDVVELKIDRIENNTNKIYFDETYNYNLITRILPSVPFVIIDQTTNYSKNLYKVVTISEVDNNEYSFFCIKHDPSKYEALDQNAFENPNSNSINNTIVFSSYDNLQEIDLTLCANYYTLNQKLTYNTISQSKIDYYLNDASSISADPNFATLTINFTTIYAYLELNSKITEILNASGGIVCKVTFKNQSIKFLSPASSYSNKTIFLGNYSFGGQISALSSIKFYLYNKNFQIIEV